LLHNSWEQLGQPSFWVSMIQIVWVNILLSGDNAVVIALACRGLPPRERKWGMIIGASLAAALRVVFTALVSVLMSLPYLKLVSALALVWIAIRLLAPEAHDEEDTPEAVASMWRAVGIVVIADVVMSLDNAIAMAAVANGQYILLVLGLAFGIPLVIAGSAAILALLERIPALVWGGAAVLGWVAGEIFAGDPVTLRLLSRFEPSNVEIAARIIGAVLVVIAGYIWRRSYNVAVSEN